MMRTICLIAFFLTLLAATRALNTTQGEAGVFTGSLGTICAQYRSQAPEARDNGQKAPLDIGAVDDVLELACLCGVDDVVTEIAEHASNNKTMASMTWREQGEILARLVRMFANDITYSLQYSISADFATNAALASFSDNYPMLAWAVDWVFVVPKHQSPSERDAICAKEIRIPSAMLAVDFLVNCLFYVTTISAFVLFLVARI